ncbi:MAG: signal peptidase I [Candidatus Pacebacteria bacterium]|nr:signal peptidase I [Candidatus Paceibacterota bacterium]
MDIENKKIADIKPAGEKKSDVQFVSDFKDEKIGIDDSGDLMNKLKNFLDLSFETIRVVIVSLVIIFVVRSFVLQPFFVDGASMQPNFHDGDYLIVNEIGYRLENPERGDVIIFRYPGDPSKFFIKRVIGLPGETVEIRAGVIKIYSDENRDGFVLDESVYLQEGTVTSGNVFETLSEGEYYVLGDNRSASSDSRIWGKLENRFIIGKAWVRAWPFDNFAVFDGEEYQN